MKLSVPIGAAALGVALSLAQGPAAHAASTSSTSREVTSTFITSGAVAGITGNKHVVQLHAYVDPWSEYVRGTVHDWTCPIGKNPPTSGKAANGCVDQGAREYLAGSYWYSGAGSASVVVADGLASAAVSGVGGTATGPQCGGMVCFMAYDGPAVPFDLHFAATAPALTLATVASGPSTQVITVRSAKVTGTFEGLTAPGTSATLKQTVTTTYSG